jgi:hypothetical protein
MPYMANLVSYIEKILILEKFNIPSLMARLCFFQSPTYWNCLENPQGQNGLAGTTVDQ